jgi:peptide/nickel transport system substrate-binding protein
MKNVDKTIMETSTSESLSQANALLDSAGFRMNEATGIREKDGKQLRFSISTADVAELRQASDLIKSDLAKVGIEVSVKVFDVGALNQNIIRPREYEALFFGQVIRNDTDLFAFWHSSQRNDPGLNIAVYTNNRVDKLLEEIISTPEPEIRDEKVREFDDIVRADSPAIFIYSPDLIYMESGKVKNIALDQITNSSERFLGISEWYVRTDAVWEFLRPKTEERANIEE